MGFRTLAFSVLSFSFLFCAMPGRAQMGNSGSIDGVVKGSIWRNSCRGDGRDFLCRQRLPETGDHRKRRCISLHERPV